MTTWPIYKRTGLDPFSGFGSLQREMNRLFDGYTGSGTNFPLLNVWANENETVVTAEVPGVDPKDIEINVLKNLLTIQGERKADDPGEDAVCHRNERVAGRFSRGNGVSQ
jgi:HSP20 family protein